MVALCALPAAVFLFSARCLLPPVFLQSNFSVLSTRYSVLLKDALRHALSALLFPRLRVSAVNFPFSCSYLRSSILYPRFKLVSP
jgi:hypothetical protein